MKIFLNGGGSGNQTIETYKEINKIIDHNKPVLYIPLALDESEHPYDDCFNWIKDEISFIDIPSIEMARTFKELSKKDFNKFSMIFIGGGNTFKLLKGLKECKIFNKIIDFINNNGIIFGSSAGAVIFGKDIETIKLMDENIVNLKDTKGFNILNGKSIFPHYINYKNKFTKEENEALFEKYTDYLINYTINNESVIAYPEENTIFIDDDTIKMIGITPVYIFENGIKNMKDIEKHDELV